MVTIHEEKPPATPISKKSGTPDYPPETETRIAECAYYKAQNRGFEPGHEIEDWLEAEREITM